MLDLLTKEYTWLESVNPHRKIGFQLSEEVDNQLGILIQRIDEYLND
jgi:hypothetical protein